MSPQHAPRRFRPAGAPAGTWPHTPWQHCVFHDPYERINFWSHAVPGALLALLGLLAHRRAVPGGAALWVFCACAATTHALSALTHVWPDDHLLEKIDHMGIVLLIVGTPLTQLMAHRPHAGGDEMLGLFAVFGGLLCAAFLRRPALRTAAFSGLGGGVIFMHWHVVDAPLLAECVLYAACALSFVRNGGHERLTGLQDHHLLHYKVTIACSIHIANVIWRARAAASEQHARSV